jgi:hypothetical protein
MGRPAFPAQALRQTMHVHKAAEIGMVHLLRLGMENQVHSAGFAQSGILFQIPWIAFQIFGWAELHRIHKNADDHPIVFADGFLHQALMAFMEIAHRRNETYRQTFLFPGLHGTADFFNRCCNLHS